MDDKRIFTFWELKECMPDYLKLCIRTWKKFLPEYEIVILDYSTIDKWLGKNFYDKSLYENFSLPKQADAIRCSILKKYGGIWFDTDTIITSNNIRNILKTDSSFSLIDRHIGFIIAKKNSIISKKWEFGIKRNIILYKLCKKSSVFRFLLSILSKKYVNRLERWDFLGNSIITKLLKNQNEETFFSFDKIKLKALPEINWSNDNNSNLSVVELYQEFYFENDFSSYALQNNKGIICLHNSWTPQNYKQMNEDEFLKQNITLAQIFIKLGFDNDADTELI